jgi:bifunctional DNA-binding transcriptional regulator/antitoxin component of YhaV-PrlF toxin-antitoxin module
MNYQKIVGDMTTKSDKIRALARAGVPTAEIARFLGIRYQHARNVLADAKKKSTEAAAEPVATPQRVFRSGHWSRLGVDGELAIPHELLLAAGLNPGERVFLRPRGDGIEIVSKSAAVKRVHAMMRKYLRPGVSEVDEFIAERRAEAKREEQGL